MALRSLVSGDLSRVPAARNRAGVRVSDASGTGRPAEVERGRGGSSGARWPSCKTHALTDSGPASVRRPPSDAWGDGPVGNTADHGPLAGEDRALARAQTAA
jgi:hypothetical protein